MITTIISSLVGLGVILQLYYFFKTRAKIRSLKKSIPPVDELKTVKVFLPKGEQLSAEQVLAQKDKHTMDPDQRIPEESFFKHLVKSSAKQ